MRVMIHKWSTVFIMLSMLSIIGCSAVSQVNTSQNAAQSHAEMEMQMASIQLPESFHNAPAKVIAAYQYAIMHSHELTDFPCYCGCGRIGHTSNLSCYIKDGSKPDNIMLDYHATGCGVCVDITLDAKRLKAEGYTPRQIRAYVDAQYSSAGPGTNTAYPVD
jgi:hypothetical protein